MISKGDTETWSRSKPETVVISTSSGNKFKYAEIYGDVTVTDLSVSVIYEDKNTRVFDLYPGKHGIKITNSSSKEIRAWVTKSSSGGTDSWFPSWVTKLRSGGTDRLFMISKGDTETWSRPKPENVMISISTNMAFTFTNIYGDITVKDCNITVFVDTANEKTFDLYPDKPEALWAPWKTITKTLENKRAVLSEIPSSANIVGAFYGDYKHAWFPGRGIDVTKIVKDHHKHGKDMFVSSEFFGCDPKYVKEKTLKVVYVRAVEKKFEPNDAKYPTESEKIICLEEEVKHRMQTCLALFLTAATKSKIQELEDQSEKEAKMMAFVSVALILVAPASSPVILLGGVAQSSPRLSLAYKFLATKKDKVIGAADEIVKEGFRQRIEKNADASNIFTLDQVIADLQQDIRDNFVKGRVTDESALELWHRYDCNGKLEYYNDFLNRWRDQMEGMTNKFDVALFVNSGQIIEDKIVKVKTPQHAKDRFARVRKVVYYSRPGGVQHFLWCEIDGDIQKNAQVSANDEICVDDLSF